MAARFGHNPNVIGWQIGNEYTDESFDDATRRQFQEWLQAQVRYARRAEPRWATAYWSQTYDRWGQIPLGSQAAIPGSLLDHSRFVSDTWRDFQRIQIDAIRASSRPAPVHHHQLGGLGW